MSSLPNHDYGAASSESRPPPPSITCSSHLSMLGNRITNRSSSTVGTSTAVVSVRPNQSGHTHQRLMSSLAPYSAMFLGNPASSSRTNCVTSSCNSASPVTFVVGGRRRPRQSSCDRMSAVPLRVLGVGPCHHASTASLHLPLPVETSDSQSGSPIERHSAAPLDVESEAAKSEHTVPEANPISSSCVIIDVDGSDLVEPSGKSILNDCSNARPSLLDRGCRKFLKKTSATANTIGQISSIKESLCSPKPCKESSNRDKHSGNRKSTSEATSSNNFKFSQAQFTFKNDALSSAIGFSKDSDCIFEASSSRNDGYREHFADLVTNSASTSSSSAVVSGSLCLKSSAVSGESHSSSNNSPSTNGAENREPSLDPTFALNRQRDRAAELVNRVTPALPVLNVVADPVSTSSKKRGGNGSSRSGNSLFPCFHCGSDSGSDGEDDMISSERSALTGPQIAAFNSDFRRQLGATSLGEPISDWAGQAMVAMPYPVHTQVEYTHFLVPSLDKIVQASYYWGVMDRFQAEKMLEGKPEGSFLLRDSAQSEYLFSVSFRRYGRTLHARIEQLDHRFSFDCYDPAIFSARTVTELIEHYKDPSVCLFFEPLMSVPVKRREVFELQHMARASVCSNIRYTTIAHLDLPRRLKDYLREYHYKQPIRVRKFDN